MVDQKGARGYPYKPDAEELRRRKAAEAAKQAQFQTEVERLAKHLDVDGNGFITLDEVKQRLRSAGVVPSGEVDKTAHQVMQDVNAGKAFTPFEFMQYLGGVLAGPQRGQPELCVCAGVPTYSAAVQASTGTSSGCTRSSGSFATCRCLKNAISFRRPIVAVQAGVPAASGTQGLPAVWWRTHPAGRPRRWRRRWRQRRRGGHVMCGDARLAVVG